MPAALLPPHEKGRLDALHSYQILDTPHEASIDILTRLAARLTGCPTALVCLVDDKRQWFKAHHGTDMKETHRDLAFCAHAILDPLHAMTVPDATADERFADNPLVIGTPGIRFYAGSPLVTPEGYALGTLCLIDYSPRQIDEDNVDTLKCLASAVMAIFDLHKTTLQANGPGQTLNDRFAHLIQAIPIALMLSGNSGQIRVINQQAECMFGYEFAELLGKPVEVLLPERFRLQHIGLRDRFFNNMSSRGMDEGKPLFGQRKDGSEFPLEIGLNPIDLDGEPMDLTVIVDISARRQIEAEQEQQRLELQRSNADLQDFAYAASHDLKAPLRAIGHLAEWIGADIDKTDNPEVQNNLKLLRSRVARMQKLLDGLLAYSRLGRTDTAAEDVDIAELVHDVAAMQDLPPGFDVVCEGAMAVIRTHRAPIQMVFKNLISNGVQHHDRSSGRIVVSMRFVDGLVEFRVEDDGPGIAKQFHETIFVIFQTLRPRDVTESTGIGLAMVKKQVESNGGQIRVESDPPARGASFVFTWKAIPPCPNSICR